MLMLASCTDLPDWEIDDRPFHDALDQLGISWRAIAWDDDPLDDSITARLVRTTWDYHTRRDEFVAWIDRVENTTQSSSPMFNPPAVLRWNTHKAYLRDLEHAGVPVLPTVWLENTAHDDVPLLAHLTQTLTDHTRELGCSRAMLKPAVGATASGTLPFACTPEGIARAAAHLHTWLPKETMLLQPFCKRVQTEGELSILMIAGKVTHAVRKVPVAGDYRVQDDFGATDMRVDVPADLGAHTEHAICAAAHATGVAREDLLYARVDFLRDDAGDPRLIELELVEPSLFFRHAPHAADRLARALAERVGT